MREGQFKIVRVKQTKNIFNLAELSNSHMIQIAQSYPLWTPKNEKDPHSTFSIENQVFLLHFTIGQKTPSESMSQHNPNKGLFWILEKYALLQLQIREKRNTLSGGPLSGWIPVE